MKRLLLLIFFGLCFNQTVLAQAGSFDSIKIYRQKLALHKKEDTTRATLLSRLANFYRRNNYDSALLYGRKALQLAKKIGFARGEIRAESTLEFSLRETGNLAEALNLQLDLLDKARQLKNINSEGVELNSIGNTYLEMGDYKTAMDYYRRSRNIFLPIPDDKGPYLNGLQYHASEYYKRNEASNMGNAFEKLNQLDSALKYETAMYNDKHFPKDIVPELLSRLGALKLKLGKAQEAMQFFRKGIQLSFKENTLNDRAILYYQLAELFNKLNQPDSSLYYAHQSYYTAKIIARTKVALDASLLIAGLYHKSGNIDSAYAYQQIAIGYKDALFGADKFRQIQLVLSQEQQRQQKLLQGQEDLKNLYRIIGAVVILVFVLILLLLVWRNNRMQASKNRLLNTQNSQITQQRDELSATVENLHRTQTQLIQSEKMASLGELTAGIAHEIQNPLNFVNNFSEVNQEMLDELDEELNKADIAQAKAILADIRENEQKINHHGKRADAIVKGMLQHSRASTGQKEPINLNALADEYLRLAYHGLRSKDKSFNAELITRFDENLPRVPALPQDIGRVILNLVNNAFYATQEKAKTADESYKPTVTITTALEGDWAKISVADNGNGIPDTIKEKILQPFFTTKPTGEGTGLGLSLSYDIIVKGHGGKINIESTEGEGSEFMIDLPLN